MEGSKHDHRRSITKYQTLFGWGAFFILIIAVGFFRYGINSFLGHPHVVTPAASDDTLEISREGSFLLEFDQRMKTKTVESAVRIDPPLAYDGNWDGNSYYLKPKAPLPEGGSYVLSIGGSAQNILGKSLQKNYSFSFRVGADPKIIAIFPDSPEITPDAKIIVMFSHAMAGEQDMASRQIPDFLRLTPEVAGEWQWRNAKTLVFTPSHGFPLSSRYHLQNTKPLMTQEATLIKGDIDLSFETKRLELAAENAANNDNDKAQTQKKLWPVREPFRFQFNQPVDLGMLNQVAKLSDASGKAIEDIVLLQPRTGEGSITLQKKSGQWLYDEGYVLNITSGLMPEDGNLGIEQDLSISFQTEPLTSGEEKFSSPSLISRIFLVDKSFKIFSQEELDPDRFQKAISFLPNTPYHLENIDKRTFVIHLDTDLRQQEQRTFYLSAALNPDGNDFIGKPISYTIGLPPPMRIEVSDHADEVCFFSATILSPQTSLSSEGAANEQLWKLVSIDPSSVCTPRDDLPYRVSLSKKFLEPGKPLRLHLDAVDNFSQKLTKDIRIKRHDIDAQDITMTIANESSYRTFHRREDLKVTAQIQNVSTLKVEACMVSAEDALRVETSYPKKWSNLLVNSANCQRLKSVAQTLDPQWGRRHDEQWSLTDFFDEPGPGLYYFHLVIPTVLDGEGVPLEAGTVLEYNSWDMLSKRGDSALLWILDHQTHQPIDGAKLTFFSNDGSVLLFGETDENGLFLQKDSKRKYAFILAKKGNEEILLNIFNQEGFEPSQQDLAFNADESPYRYHFFVENIDAQLSAIHARAILQQKKENRLVPLHQTFTVYLSNAKEEVYWKKLQESDEFGVVDIDIQSPYPLLNGVYQLGICMGTFEGVCEGTNFWTNLVIAGGHIDNTQPTDQQAAKVEQRQHHRITVDRRDEVSVGDTLQLTIDDLKPATPVLITMEREGIYFATTIVPGQSTIHLPVQIEAAMIPEFFVTVTQFDEQSTLYDMISVPVDRGSLTAPIQQADYDAGKISVTAFRLKPVSALPSVSLLASFYPRQGTSIVTGSNRTDDSSTANLSIPSSTSADLFPSDLTVIDGHLLTPEQTANLIKDQHVLDPGSRHLTAPYLLLVDDRSGHAATITLPEDEVSAAVSISTDLPDFIRPGDKPVLPVRIKNQGGRNENLQLISFGTGIDLLASEAMMVGIPEGQEKTFSIGSMVSALGDLPTAGIRLELKDGETLVTDFNRQIPVVRPRHSLQTKRLVVVQSAQGSGQIELPIKGTGMFFRTVLVSPSPISFVLENLHEFLKRESLRFEEEFFKKVTAVNYIKLMEAALESDQEFASILQERNNIDNELSYLATRQKVDGGWSPNTQDIASDPLFTVSIAKSLALLQQLQIDLPRGLIGKTIVYLKNQLEKVAAPQSSGDEQALQQYLVLNALSSLTPAGVTTANSLYPDREKLSTEELVLLLLTLEDFRDAGVSGMTYKVEELIQLLKNRQRQLRDELWLEANESSGDISTFTLTSWYLEGLVRQASARNDIPGVITWLVKNKYNDEVQTMRDQYAFLQVMASYFRIFHEDIHAKTLTLDLGTLPGHVFSVDASKPFQSFVVRDFISRDDSKDDSPTMSFAADAEQSWFIEVDWSPLDQASKSISNGLSVDQRLEDHTLLTRGKTVNGAISIISPVARDNVIIAQPLVAGTTDLDELNTAEKWRVKSFGNQEKWYLIDHLDAGETVIPFTWTLNASGIFTAPPVVAWGSDHPEISAQSDAMTLEIRDGNQ